MTDRGDSSRRGESAPGVRRWCEDFASRAGTYPFPLRTPAHGWPARPKRTRYVVAAPLARGSRHVRLRRSLKWEKRQPIQGFFQSLPGTIRAEGNDAGYSLAARALSGLPRRAQVRLSRSRLTRHPMRVEALLVGADLILYG